MRLSPPLASRCLTFCWDCYAQSSMILVKRTTMTFTIGLAGLSAGRRDLTDLDVSAVGIFDFKLLFTWIPV